MKVLRFCVFSNLYAKILKIIGNTKETTAFFYFFTLFQHWVAIFAFVWAEGMNAPPRKLRKGKENVWETAAFNEEGNKKRKAGEGLPFLVGYDMGVYLYLPYPVDGANEALVIHDAFVGKDDEYHCHYRQEYGPRDAVCACCVLDA